MEAMTPNIDAMVQQGVKAYRAGNKSEARAFLLKAVELDEQNEQAWLWLSAVVDDVEEQITCLENVLVVNPNNQQALKGIAALKAKRGTAKPSASGDDEMPSNLEWDLSATPSSSPSSTFRAPEPTKQEYDDWVSSLNLGSGAASGGNPAFNSGPFGADMFGADDDAGIAPPPAPARGAPPPAPRGAAPIAAAASVPLATSGSRTSPNPAPAKGKSSPAAAPSIFGDAAADFASDDEDAMFGGATAERGMYDDDEGGAEVDPLELLKRIPPEIKATRLPGTIEKHSALNIGIAVLVILNVFAIAGLVLVAFGV
jgi:tetratricopeptide (TPR) repeat protein